MRFRSLAYFFSLLLISGCSEDRKKQSEKFYPPDSTIIQSLSFTTPFIPGHQFECGTADLFKKEYQKIHWADSLNSRMICDEFHITKKNYFKFIETVNKTDSFRIITPDIDWLAGFDESDKTEVPDTGCTIFLFRCFPEQICVFKLGENDSVPVSMAFSWDSRNNISMTLCMDTSVSAILEKILSVGRLARLRNRTRRRVSLD